MWCYYACGVGHASGMGCKKNNYIFFCIFEKNVYLQFVHSVRVRDKCLNNNYVRDM